MGEPIPFRRRHRALPAGWVRFVQPQAFTAEQLRLTMWIGMLLGLLGFQALRFWPAPAPMEWSSGGGTSGSSAYVRVIDGDTFDYAGARIRIADIDTPEVQGRCPEESALAAQATRRLGVLLAEGPFELHRPPGGSCASSLGAGGRWATCW